nr:immunoglobulin light chain junction region [Macaca mulatta]MOW28137.1 immunoglobulin light chain junction region [Macaca mulatta]MOW28191.1 immunoglobulin light chain junction region [Macaca mulatta]MOW28215.1 immunoglobulin light chain junction region [Macaca mulatta]MOW28629.1 immunoglobulin light chain junction region [Macaca mulatta]
DYYCSSWDSLSGPLF